MKQALEVKRDFIIIKGKSVTVKGRQQSAREYYITNNNQLWVLKQSSSLKV